MLLDMLSYFLEWSHSLFTVYLEIEKGDEKNKKIRTGKLNLVEINLSLTSLGSVIDALSSNRKHILYKD